MKRAFAVALTGILVAGPAVAAQDRGIPIRQDSGQVQILQPRDADVVRLAQQRLREFGYDVQVDGNMGANTLNAVESYQLANNLRPTGTLDLLTLSALGVQIDATGLRRTAFDQGPGAGTAAGPMAMEMEDGRLISSALVGSTLYSENGRPLGTVENLLLDPEQGRVVGAMVDLEPAAAPPGIERMAIAWDRLTYDADNRLIADIGIGEIHGAAAGPAAQISAAGNPVLATQLMGAPVRSADGRYLGEVERLLVDPANGRVTAALVDLDESVRQQGVELERLLVGWRRLDVIGNEVVAQAPFDEIRGVPTVDDLRQGR